MTPPIESFPASELYYRVQSTVQGRRRKKDVDLTRCQLRELVQYACHLEKSVLSEQPVIQCRQIVRLFRQCEDGLVVETTALEGPKMNGGIVRG